MRLNVQPFIEKNYDEEEYVRIRWCISITSIAIVEIKRFSKKI